MTDVPTLAERDARVIAGVEKLRFFPLEVEAGEGCWLIEPGGRRLLDLSATWTASGLGHGHPALTDAIARAARRPGGAGILSAVHPESVGLAEDLLALVPGSGDRRVYLGHAGSDACDVVLRACRHATGRSRIVAFEHGYHGGVGVAMGVSGVHVDAGAQPDAAAVFASYPDPYRPHTADPATVARSSLAAVEQQLAADDVACVIVEAIQSDGGLVVPPDGFLSELQALCRRYGVLLICDEVKVGLGRTGLLHAFDHEGITPDIVTFGKTLGGGLPLSAAVGPAEILDGPSASALLTTAGNPVCVAAGRAMLRTLVEERIPDTAADRGAQLAALMRTYADSGRPGAAFIGQVRGRGLSIGIDLVTDQTKRTRAADLARKVVYRAWQLGAVVYYVGENVMEVTPPMVISPSEVELAADLLTKAIDDAVDGVVTDEMVAPYSGW
ncbi:aminotransferase class III-fold pyridoxal phosphate-dependent enzyme [Streptomyces sp. NPDC001508]|uniref:aspartate aminotransferase family protein n=1 Tax=Streptomyces sp. NPDC001508 TaxID=3154656 RepID=UPI003321F634